MVVESVRIVVREDDWTVSAARRARGRRGGIAVVALAVLRWHNRMRSEKGRGRKGWLCGRVAGCVPGCVVEVGGDEVGRWNGGLALELQG